MQDNQLTYDIWSNDEHYLWQYFSKRNSFIAKCEMCEILFYFPSKTILESHLITRHVRAIGQNLSFRIYQRLNQ